MLIMITIMFQLVQKIKITMIMLSLIINMMMQGFIVNNMIRKVEKFTKNKFNIKEKVSN